MKYMAEKNNTTFKEQEHYFLLKDIVLTHQLCIKIGFHAIFAPQKTTTDVLYKNTFDNREWAN